MGSLAAARVAEAHTTDRGGFFYVRDFITEEEESYLCRKIDSAPRPQWKQLKHRRLQQWGGELAKRTGALLPAALPAHVTAYPDLISRIAATGAFRESRHAAPNHCLVNEYLPGEGILPHTDGPAYFPAVATISLQGHTLLDIYTHVPGEACAAEPVFSLLQEPRSLLITCSDAYTQFLHGIAERDVDEPVHLSRVANKQALGGAWREACERGALQRTRRVSLTFRDVEKVHKGLRLGK
ncbi:hypothetical protein MCAP1_001590 [Malassezia caprae]|uniref:Fe2OG dioxygenase domain-containing protein n=1 Tax=Malassezia caprae TaxID=1381934 RepID=A0AAF0IZU2_9BASI|nr:hypothetical protein MCAP1_001590 [Malassezia caprae]